MKRKLMICCLTVIAAIVGCTSGPSDRQARANLQKWFDTRWPSAVLVMNYDAVSKAGDERNYVVEYKARARFVKDINGCVITCCGEFCFDKMVNGLRWISKASDDPHVIRRGDLFEMSGKDTYTKTGKAWSRQY